MRKMTNDEGMEDRMDSRRRKPLRSLALVIRNSLLFWNSSFNQPPGVIAACCNPDSTPPPHRHRSQGETVMA